MPCPLFNRRLSLDIIHCLFVPIFDGCHSGSSGQLVVDALNYSQVFGEYGRFTIANIVMFNFYNRIQHAHCSVNVDVDVCTSYTKYTTNLVHDCYGFKLVLTLAITRKCGSKKKEHFKMLKNTYTNSHTFCNSIAFAGTEQVKCSQMVKNKSGNFDFIFDSTYILCPCLFVCGSCFTKPKQSEQKKKWKEKRTKHLCYAAMLCSFIYYYLVFKAQHKLLTQTVFVMKSRTEDQSQTCNTIHLRRQLNCFRLKPEQKPYQNLSRKKKQENEIR